MLTRPTVKPNSVANVQKQHADIYPCGPRALTNGARTLLTRDLTTIVQDSCVLIVDFKKCGCVVGIRVSLL